MQTLRGNQIYLRAIEPEDLSFLHEVENDERIWELSHTQTPYSRYVLKQYLENAHQDIYEAKQLRLVISDLEDHSIGLIDLFDFDFKNRRAGVGILIKELEDRQRGFGREALQLLIDYSFSHLHLHQLYCNINEDNQASVNLFVQLGFEIVGKKRDWNFTGSTYKNEYLLQLIKT